MFPQAGKINGGQLVVWRFTGTFFCLENGIEDGRDKKEEAPASNCGEGST